MSKMSGAFGASGVSGMWKRGLSCCKLPDWWLEAHCVDAKFSREVIVCAQLE